MIDLAPAVIVEEICALANILGRGGLESLPRFELIGRRNVRSKNSWLRNIPTLVAGRARNTLQMHPRDATELALEDGATALVSSAVGSVSAKVEMCDGLRPGVVSLAHGWSDDLDGCRLAIAASRRGPNSNLLADTGAIDPLSGTALLNGIPVTIASAEHEEKVR